jgi:hypothetical protein
MVSIAFDIAESKGAQFDGITDGGQFMSELSEVWAMNKDSIKQMTESQARSYLKKVIEA